MEYSRNLWFIRLVCTGCLIAASIPNSQPFPPTREPQVCSVSLFLFHRQVHLCCILDSHISDTVWNFFLSFWLPSMRISSCIHVAMNGIISFFFKAESNPSVYVPHLLCPLLFWAMVGCFHVVTIVNCALMIYTGGHVSLWVMVFSGYMPRGRIAGLYAFSLLVTCVMSLKTIINTVDSK